MSTGMIGSSLSGLQAAQLGLQTTQHNIANAKTAGYTRQQTVQASNDAMKTGAGFVGQGTHVATIERVYSQFLTNQVTRSQSSASELDSYYAQVKQIDNLLADPTTGVSPALQGFFQSVQDVAADPGQLSSRQAMISSAQTLSAQYQSVGGQLAQMYADVNGQIAATVAGINSGAEQIAALNQKIGIAEASVGQPANDLRDLRDQALLDLNKLIKTTTSTNGDGSINVLIGSGQQLVVGSLVVDLTTTRSSADPSRLVIGRKTTAGIQEMPESLISGGSLGGLLAFRRESLDQTSNDLGRQAASLALTFNAQSALGQDLLGQSAAFPAPPALSSFTPNFFSLAQPTVIADHGNPATSPTLSATFVSPPPFSGNFYTDLGRSDYQISSDGTTVTLTRLTDNMLWTGSDVTAVNAKLALDPQGFTLAASAPLVAGSSYLVQPTRNAAQHISVNAVVAADPRLIAAAGPMISSAAKANTGAATVSAGSAGPGYAAAVAAAPMSLVYQSGGLQNFPVGAQVSINGGVPVTIAAPTDVVPYTSGASITLVGSVVSTPPSGFSFTIAGLPNNGDTFSLARNAGGTADGRNMLALGQLQTQHTMSGQTTSFQDAYAQLVSDTGSKTRQIQVSGQAQKSILDQARSSLDSFSAVNLDEEAANLLSYQQAYQASAKALQIGNSLFDTILAIVAA
ncbi:Flagellar hook-associated protein FlgK [Candidatus Accumulibacter aalborgensis]|uniref:Flagellar hook-associated protein 1 n=1 Tax=Candidatus Accumulibacter aalborgensis TaxID=1860102 RepID=A0A1A8XIN1_9PROT|nr:flagellar hook-associated protein FlgK [Candidatus Accumulibacter aalborgensis]SBT05044.1 Flagellar hook-associated protein FlgK [Candidatus Accumulibacter aalborgensis]